MKNLEIPVPLFGQAASLINGAASDDPGECALIEGSLLRFDVAMGALASHKVACDFLVSLSSSGASVKKRYRCILEKMLLWCFLIKKKSLYALDNIDLIDFLSFCESPPSDWVSATRTRFRSASGDVVIEKKWRPFRSHDGSSYQSRSLVNRFVTELSWYFQPGLHVPHQLFPRMKAANLTIDRMLRAGVEHLYSLSIIKDVKARKEEKLFSFACCLHLRIGLRYFAELAENSYTTDFVKNSEGGWIYCIDAQPHLLIGTLPEDFSVHLARYKSYLGMSPLSIGHSPTPLFQPVLGRPKPSAKTIYGWGVAMPEIKQLNISTNEFLTRLAKLEVLRVGLQPEKQAVKQYHRDKDALYLERAYKNIKQNPMEIEDSKNAPNPIGGSYESPAPLFRYPVELDSVQLAKDRDRLVSLLQGYGHECAAEISLWVTGFVDYLASQSRAQPAMKIVSYEKFILWAVIVKRASVNSMTESDIAEFHEFCVSPPDEWITDGRFRRFLIGSNRELLIDQRWRPFYMRGAESFSTSLLRAARIVDYCNSVQRGLVASGVASKSLFEKLTKRLWGVTGRS